MYGADVECVDSWTGAEKKIVVAGFSDGKIELFHYPCVSQKSSSWTLCGHYKRIGRIRWVNSEEFISISSDNKAMMMWKAFPEIQNQNELADDKKTEERKLDEDVALPSPKEDIRTKSSKWDIEMQSHRPWVASVVAPTNCASDPEKEVERPNENIRLSTINCSDGEYLHYMRCRIRFYSSYCGGQQPFVHLEGSNSFV